MYYIEICYIQNNTLNTNYKSKQICSNYCAAGWTLTWCQRTQGLWHLRPFSCLCCSSNLQIPWASSCNLFAWWHQWHQHSALALHMNSVERTGWWTVCLAPFSVLGGELTCPETSQSSDFLTFSALGSSLLLMYVPTQTHMRERPAYT